MREIIIPQAIMDELQRITLTHHPTEACGVLIGIRNNQSAVITKHRQITNIHESPEKAYLLDPEQLAQAFIQAEQENQEIIAVYHTHPTKATTPSQTDQTQAWPEIIYLILAKQEHNHVTYQAWKLNHENHEFKQIPIIIR